MSNKTTKEKIAVMQAFEEGKEIEFCAMWDHPYKWEISSSPTWNWYDGDYRIKKQSHWVDWSIISPEYKYLWWRGYSEVLVVTELPPIKPNSEGYYLEHSYGGCFKLHGLSSHLYKIGGDFREVVVRPEATSHSGIIIRPE